MRPFYVGICLSKEALLRPPLLPRPPTTASPFVYDIMHREISVHRFVATVRYESSAAALAAAFIPPKHKSATCGSRLLCRTTARRRTPRIPRRQAVRLPIHALECARRTWLRSHALPLLITLPLPLRLPRALRLSLRQGLGARETCFRTPPPQLPSLIPALRRRNRWRCPSRTTRTRTLATPACPHPLVTFLQTLSP